MPSERFVLSVDAFDRVPDPRAHGFAQPFVTVPRLRPRALSQTERTAQLVDEEVAFGFECRGPADVSVALGVHDLVLQVAEASAILVDRRPIEDGLVRRNT